MSFIPAAIGAIAAAAPSIASVASYVAPIVGAGGMIYSGMAEGQAAGERAKIARQQAAAAKVRSAEEERQSRERYQRLMGTQRALYGKAGVRMEGSPLLVLAETAREAEREAEYIRKWGHVEAGQRQSEAEMEKKAATTSRWGGLMGGGTTLLTGYSKLLR